MDNEVGGSQRRRSIFQMGVGGGGQKLGKCQKLKLCMFSGIFMLNLMVL